VCPEATVASSQRRSGADGASPRRVLVIDNYDSFTYNVVQLLGELGAEVAVVRNDSATVDDLLARARERGERLVVSPGPCTPREAGISVAAIRRFGEAGVPVLGICLGHQAIAVAFGGRVVRGQPVHGKAATIEHDGKGVFSGLPTPIEVGRYHSLVVDLDLPPELAATAWAGEVLMGLRHRSLPVEGVQFHPESVLTPHGRTMLANFLTLAPDSANA